MLSWVLRRGRQRETNTDTQRKHTEREGVWPEAETGAIQPQVKDG